LGRRRREKRNGLRAELPIRLIPIFYRSNKTEYFNTALHHLTTAEMRRNESESPSTKAKLGFGTREVTATTETALFDGECQPAVRQMTGFHYFSNPSFIITASIQQVVTKGYAS
jgi:hypothetical protein